MLRKQLRPLGGRFFRAKKLAVRHTAKSVKPTGTSAKHLGIAKAMGGVLGLSQIVTHTGVDDNGIFFNLVNKTVFISYSP